MAYQAETGIGTGQVAIANTWTDVVGGTLTSLKAYDVFQVQISAKNNSAGVTDSLDVRVLASTGTNFDENGMTALQITPAVAATAAPGSLLLSGYYKYKVQVMSTGATDTYDISASYVKEYQT